MVQLQNELKQAEIEEETAFGKLARRVGIFDLDIPETDLREALTEMANRFRPNGRKEVVVPEAKQKDVEGAPDGVEGAASAD